MMVTSCPVSASSLSAPEEPAPEDRCEPVSWAEAALFFFSFLWFSVYLTSTLFWSKA